MHPRLTIQHPRVWIESRAPRQFDHVSRTWSFAPTSTEEIAAEYERLLFGQLVSYCLQRLNSDLLFEDDDEATAILRTDLRLRAHAAGQRVGVEFGPRAQNAGRVLMGILSSAWLDRASAKAIERALSQWDPVTADARRRSARIGGMKSKRRPMNKPDDLVRGSVKAQAEALGCSVSTVKRLRRRAREAQQRVA